MLLEMKCLQVDTGNTPFSFLVSKIIKILVFETIAWYKKNGSLHHAIISIKSLIKGAKRMGANLIEVKGLTKRFNTVVANDHVDFSVKAGEIHALLGENGAGKSTLISMLSGVYTPDEGAIFIEGKEVRFASTKDAISAGIGTIYQHLKLIEAMKAKDNIVLGQEKKLFISYKKILAKAEEIKSKYDIEVELDKYVYNMTVGERQNLEIIKVMNRGAKILILDEPTTVFTPQEAKKLFQVMKKMKEQGCAVIFITHKLDEVMEIADRITILRGGKTITTVNKSDVNNPKELTELMMGEPLDLHINIDKCTSNETLLQVKNLVVKNKEGRKKINDVSFQIKKGEVLGIAGIAGCGQKELCEALTGIRKIEQGNIILEDEFISGKNAEYMIKKGLGINFIPEDRLGMGLVGSMDMIDNLLLRDYKKTKGIFVDRKKLVPKAKALMKDFEVKTPSIHFPIRYLSGGNIQKILLGRELSLNPKLLIMAYPVRGLDVKTAYAIYDIIAKVKKSGTSVLFIGEDLDILMQISDRIMVLNNGEITGIVDGAKATKDELGLLMVGSTVDSTVKGGEQNACAAS
jgi:simple sugar transport system ATP-binding protein